MKYILFYALLFHIYYTSCVAQDTIIIKNNRIIKAKITEISADEIKYKIFGVDDSPTILLKKADAQRISISGQTVYENADISTDSKEDILVKKTGETIKIKLLEVGTEEIKFKNLGNSDSPILTLHKSEIKLLKVDGQVIIDSKTTENKDLIIKKDGTKIKAIVVELNASEVKYKLSSNPTSPILSLNKNKEVQSISIDGQTAYEYKPDPYSISNQSIMDKTHVVKFYFLSPLYNNLAVGYEWVNKPGFNWDAGVGIIGMGASKNLTQQPKGMFLRFGPKFLLGSTSDLEIENARYAHPLRGKYIKIEAILNSFSSTSYMDTSSYFNNVFSLGKLYYANKYQSVTINLQFGKQIILGKTLTFAWYAGIGYSFESSSTTLPSKYRYQLNAVDIKRYSHAYYGERFPLATTLGITLGYLFKPPVKKPNKLYKEGEQKASKLK
jgi:hypothetical protein